MNFLSWAFSRDFWNSPTNLLWSGNKLFNFISKIKKNNNNNWQQINVRHTILSSEFRVAFFEFVFQKEFRKKSCFLSEQTFHDNLFKILFYTNIIFCSSSLLLLLFLLFFGFLWMLNTCKYLNLFHFRFCCCYFRMV